jgi:hypothetical protein
MLTLMSLHAQPGFMKDHPGDMEAHPGLVEVYLGAMEPHPVALEAHPGALEAHSCSMEILEISRNEDHFRIKFRLSRKSKSHFRKHPT